MRNNWYLLCSNEDIVSINYSILGRDFDSNFKYFGFVKDSLNFILFFNYGKFIVFVFYI